MASPTSHTGVVKELIKAFDAANHIAKKTQDLANDPTIRELVRSELCSIAETLRKQHGLTVLEVRQLLHEMLPVSI